MPAPVELGAAFPESKEGAIVQRKADRAIAHANPQLPDAQRAAWKYVDLDTVLEVRKHKAGFIFAHAERVLDRPHSREWRRPLSLHKRKALLHKSHGAIGGNGNKADAQCIRRDGNNLQLDRLACDFQWKTARSGLPRLQLRSAGVSHDSAGCSRCR